MKSLTTLCLLILLVPYLSGCSFLEDVGCVNKDLRYYPESSPPPPPSLRWSDINIHSIDEENKWLLAPGLICYAGPPVYSTDGKTIYFLADSTVQGFIGSSVSFLIKSDDYGHTWDLLPALEKLRLHEALAISTVDSDMFILSTDFGAYRSIDGGNTFEKLPSIPDTGFVYLEEQRYHSDRWYWCLDTTLDDSGNPLILVGTVHGLGGLWMLSYPYEKWVDLKVGNAKANTKYDVWKVAFSPNYAEDKQILALVSDGHHLRVTFKYGNERWERRIADAQIPDTETKCDLDIAFTDFKFPDDYDSQNPVVYIGAGLYTEHLYETPQYADLYQIIGKPAGSGPSVAVDLDVGGEGTITPIFGLAVRGSTHNTTVLAGSVGNVYRSSDSGKNWVAAEKPPTGGAIAWISFDPRSNDNTNVYCMSTDHWHFFAPRGTDIPISESAFSYSVDGGDTWNQRSLISTTIDETISQVASPNYKKDKTMFLLTRSSSTFTVSFDEDEIVYITRHPDSYAAKTKVIIVNHLGNPPSERVKIRNRDHVAGTAPLIILDDKHPSVALKTLPLLEQPDMREQLEQLRKTKPWFVEQYLNLHEQPRKVVIYVLDGLVSVTKGKLAKNLISVDGHASDWQGIKPLATDPEGDALLRDEDIKALYATNDLEYLYFMIEFYGQNPNLKGEIFADIDNDGIEDYRISMHFVPDCPDPIMFLMECPSDPTSRAITEDEAAFGTILEARIPLEFFVNVEGSLNITKVHSVRSIGGEETNSDIWSGPIEIKIEDLGFGGTDLTSFPSTESLWRTTDCGKTWERVLTSGLKISVDGEEIQVGSLDSITLSDNFAIDNTMFVYENSDKPKTWISNDCGVTFRPQN